MPVIDHNNLPNVTATSGRDPNVANSIYFPTGMPIGFFDNEGLASSLTQGEGYQTGVSADIEREIAAGLAIQRAQHEKKLEGELEEELSDALEGEVAEGVEFALDESGEHASLIDSFIRSALEGPTSGIRALNKLLDIVPGLSKLTGGIESLLDAPGLILGDALSRSPLGRSIDDAAMPITAAGESSVGAAKDRVSAFGDRFDAVVNPIEMVLRGIKILNDPIGAATDVAFKNRPDVRRLIEFALEGAPPGMAQGGPVMNYNDPLMMRFGGMARRRGRRGGIEALLARRRQQRGRRGVMSPNEQRMMQNRAAAARNPGGMPMPPEDMYERMNPPPGYGRPNRPDGMRPDGMPMPPEDMYERMIERRTGNNPPPNWGLPNRGQQFRAGGGVYSPPPMFDPGRANAMASGEVQRSGAGHGARDALGMPLSLSRTHVPLPPGLQATAAEYARRSYQEREAGGRQPTPMRGPFPPRGQIRPAPARQDNSFRKFLETYGGTYGRRR